ncbi:MAG: hypothetical protein HN712_15685 [Gemmatimonadetes bacterium]|jgi:hypothetical protein|nr:hypothetical protein [Gemmatimonadota bacterium]MBT7861762.1 hypothetical protein [Gemmatimonadota bacterium]
MRKTITALAAFAVLAGSVAPVTARDDRPSAAAKVAQDYAFGERALLNINNMSLWFKRDGFSARNPLNDNSGVTFPRSTDQVIFQDGLIWGGLVQDGDPQELRVGGQTYEVGTVPGAIVSRGVAEDPSDPSVRIYRIRRDYQTADLRLDAAELLGLALSEVSSADEAAVRGQYAKDWQEWPAAKGAPFYDNDGDGVYSPSIDEPGVAGGDQVAWFVINDLDLGAAQSLYGSKPIGLEVGVTMWGYARTDALGDVIFKKYTIVYEGTATTPDDATIEDMYIAQWSDPDLGDYGDDFAGSDVGLSLGYVYNGQEDDSHYVGFGLAPPAVGYDFLQGPIVPVYTEDEDGNQVLDMSKEAVWNFGRRPGYENLPMTSFVFFAAGSAIDDPELGEYVGTEEWYNLLRGFQPQPDITQPVPFTNPITGADTKFTLDGDPTRATGWNDGIPLPAGDRRIVLDTGPFVMALGDTQEVVVALLGAISSTRLRSVAQLKFTDQFVQDAYNSAFQVPSPPAAPLARLAQLDQTVVIDWGWDPASVEKTEGSQSAGFAFEGYNVYQLPSAEAQLSQGIKLGTFDAENGVTTILGIDLDAVSGIVLDVPKQIGGDNGIRRNLRISTDALRGGPLVNGQSYYFAVTAYNRATGEAAAVTTLESSSQLLIAKPQSPPLGVRYGAEAAQIFEGAHQAGTSDGTVVASVVDPTQTTGHDYEVAYGADADGNTIWKLRDVTMGSDLLVGQTDQSATPLYIGSDGFEIRVSGPPSGMKDWDIPSGARWFTWASADWAAEGFGGAMTGNPNAEWFNATTVTPDQLRSVELRFTSVNEGNDENTYKPLDLTNENVSYAYRYLRGAGGDVPAPGDMTTAATGWDQGKYVINTEGAGYIFQDRVPIAMSAWDIEADPPRRLEIGFLENLQPGGLVNGAYGPAFYGDADNTASGGPREWLFIFDEEYTDPGAGQNTDLLLNSGLYDQPLPHMWIIFANRRGETRFPQDGDSFLLIANHVNTADDVFSFSVPGAEVSDEAVADDLKKITAFPNPYYGVNEAETTRYSKFVTFSHLPSRAVVRIFDLSGALVRTLEKDDADQFLRWDLGNDNGLPVASGMYVAHIKMEQGTRIVKLAVITEQQFLENF